MPWALRLWTVFFLISFGLGYPTLNRLDPTRTQALRDSRPYFEMVRSGPAANAGHWQYRLLVPMAARPIYLLARGHVESWNPVAFAMLVVNAAFTAATAAMMVAICGLLRVPVLAAVVAAFAYLLNFDVANKHLAGLIDSADTFFGFCLAFVLLAERPRLLPLIGILGAATKETFVVTSTLFVAGWLWRRRGRSLSWAIAMAGLGLLTTYAIQCAIETRLITPFDSLADMHRLAGFRDLLSDITAGLRSWNHWLTFIWLAPFAFYGRDIIPGEWKRATLSSVAGVILMAAWSRSLGQVARPIFDVAGPMLAVMFAVGLSVLFNRAGTKPDSAAARESAEDKQARAAKA